MPNPAAATFTPEQTEYRHSVARFLQNRNAMSQVRQLINSSPGYDQDAWQALASDLGATGLHLPEAFGGSGFGAVELGIVLEEMGRHLYCGPYFSSVVMAGSALLACPDDPAKTDYLPGIADGSRIAALVLDSLDNPAAVGTGIRASSTGKNSTLTGSASTVVGADVATLLLVIAGTPDGPALFAVDDPSTAQVRKVASLDPSRSLANVQFNNTGARLLGPLGDSGVHQLWQQLSIHLAHELVGAAEALLYSSIDYMGIRVQFGRPIASFQALKHRCADLLLEVELAKALSHEAARCLDAGTPATELAHMAKAMASDACMSAARAGIQLRGGIGFTWEDDTHFWFKRAKSSEVFLGTPQQHREWLIAHLQEQPNAQ